MRAALVVLSVTELQTAVREAGLQGARVQQTHRALKR